MIAELAQQGKEKILRKRKQLDVKLEAKFETLTTLECFLDNNKKMKSQKY